LFALFFTGRGDYFKLLIEVLVIFAIAFLVYIEFPPQNWDVQKYYSKKKNFRSLFFLFPFGGNCLRVVLFWRLFFPL